MQPQMAKGGTYCFNRKMALCPPIALLAKAISITDLEIDIAGRDRSSFVIFSNKQMAQIRAWAKLLEDVTTAGRLR